MIKNVMNKIKNGILSYFCIRLPDGWRYSPVKGMATVSFLGAWFINVIKITNAWNLSQNISDTYALGALTFAGTLFAVYKVGKYKTGQLLNSNGRMQEDNRGE